MGGHKLSHQSLGYRSQNYRDSTARTPSNSLVEPEGPMCEEISSEPPLDLSQELRTPLTAIQGALGLLSSGRLGTLSQQGQRMLEIAANNVDRLMRLTTAIEHQPQASPIILLPDELARLRLEEKLYGALQRHEFKLYYQPLVSLVTAQATGFEALLRWQHPSLGMISPEQFVPLAESNGLIRQIGAWALRQACCQLQAWQTAHPQLFQSLSISINLSSHQLIDTQLVALIEQVLQETGLAADRLKLEITESAVMANLDCAEATLVQLQDLGLQLYIDDFGTGYSSLSRLLELPLDVLKIDRSFVQQLSSQRGEHLVRAITNLARNLGADVIAEGVETEEQAHLLESLGCYRGQGFLFAPPLESDAIVPFLLSANA